MKYVPYTICALGGIYLGAIFGDLLFQGHQAVAPQTGIRDGYFAVGMMSLIITLISVTLIRDYLGEWLLWLILPFSYAMFYGCVVQPASHSSFLPGPEWISWLLLIPIFPILLLILDIRFKRRYG